jgi:hypothetical protein
MIFTTTPAATNSRQANSAWAFSPDARNATKGAVATCNETGTCTNEERFRVAEHLLHASPSAEDVAEALAAKPSPIA